MGNGKWKVRNEEGGMDNGDQETENGNRKRE